MNIINCKGGTPKNVLKALKKCTFENLQSINNFLKIIEDINKIAHTTTSKYNLAYYIKGNIKWKYKVPKTFRDFTKFKMYLQVLERD